MAERLRPPNGPMNDANGNVTVAWMAYFQALADVTAGVSFGGIAAALVAHDAALANHELRIAGAEAALANHEARIAAQEAGP